MPENDNDMRVAYSACICKWAGTVAVGEAEAAGGPSAEAENSTDPAGLEMPKGPIWSYIVLFGILPGVQMQTD